MATVIESVSALDAALKRCNNRPGVIYFRADWVAPCKQCDAVIKALAEQNKGVVFMQVEAESVPDASKRFEIASVPTFVILENGNESRRINGALIPELTKTVAELAKTAPAPTNDTPTSSADLEDRLRSLVKQVYTATLDGIGHA
jgi:thioredoxin-like negative regulator of GroEL